MLLVLGLAIVAIGVAITLLSPNAGLMVYMAWFMVRPQEVWRGLGGEVPLERILVLALLASLIIHHRLMKAEPFFSSRITWALLAFVAVNYLSIPTAVWRSGALLVANELGKTLVFYICLINLITNTKELRRFIWVYVLGVGWLAGSSLWAFGAHPYYAQGIQRATSLEVTWGDPNAIASNIALAIPILVALFVGAGGFLKRVFLAGLFVVYVICIVLTGSRAGLIVTVLVFLLMALYSSKRLVLIPALLGLLSLTWLLIPQEYQTRYKTLLLIGEDVRGQNNDTSEGESAHGRVIGFEVAMQMFRDRPIIGVGAGDFAPAWFDPNTPYTYYGYKGWHQPHNLPGQLLAELGILGAISFGFYIVTLLRLNRAARREFQALHNPPKWLIGLSKAIVVTLIALFVGGFAGHNLYRYNWYLAGGLVAVLSRLKEREKAVAESSESSPLPALNQMDEVGQYSFLRHGEGW